MRIKNLVATRKNRIAFQSYMMIATMIIGFCVFTIYPLSWAIQKAWFFYSGVPSETRFIGFENFINVFSDKTYWQTWLTTLKFAVIKMPIELPLALITAILLSRKIKGKGFFRAMYFLPNVISVAIIGLIFSNLFDYFGFINAWLVKLGVVGKEIDWFANTGTSLSVLITGSIWATYGVNVLYFMSALSNVPKDVYESAKIDGASRWTVFWKITLPLIAPVLQIILLLSINGTLRTGEYVLTLTGGAPSGTTFTVESYIINQFVPGFASTDVVNIGYGCAMSIITTIILGMVAALFMKLSKRMQNIY